MSSLLEHVHFPLMSLDEIDKLAKDTKVKKAKIFEQAREYVNADSETKVKYWNERRKPERWPKILVVMRMYWKNIPMEYYDFRYVGHQRMCCTSTNP